MRNTTGIGDVTEWQVAAALVRAGKKLLRPLSSAMRYDLLIDDEDGTFTRVQCKTGVLRNGCIQFRVCSVSGHDSRARPYHSQIDAFGVFCPETSTAYLVPIAVLATCDHVASLRVEPSRNGQKRGVRDAAAFEIRRDGSARPATPRGTAGSTR
ncbi:MAG: group I intron-associated PD-(D/E)XK endonuclease [Candidatus Limnocylindria bacterium]